MINSTLHIAIGSSALYSDIQMISYVHVGTHASSVDSET